MTQPDRINLYLVEARRQDIARRVPPPPLPPGPRRRRLRRPQWLLRLTIGPHAETSSAS